MIIVSDTTAITSLLQINQLELLHDLFGEVLIPPAVHQELMAYHPSLPVFIKVSASVPLNAPVFEQEQLDQGEIEAIALARELHARYLIIDELIGRRIAENLGINCIGLVGVLIWAREAGLVSSLKAMLEQLEQVAGFYLNESIKAKALRSVGESP